MIKVKVETLITGIRRRTLCKVLPFVRNHRRQPEKKILQVGNLSGNMDELTDGFCNLIYMSYKISYANKLDIANRTYLSVWHSIAGPPITRGENPYSEFSAKVMLDIL